MQMHDESMRDTNHNSSDKILNALILRSVVLVAGVAAFAAAALLFFLLMSIFLLASSALN